MASKPTLHHVRLNETRPKDTRNTKCDVLIKAAPKLKSSKLCTSGYRDENQDPSPQDRGTKIVDRSVGVSRLPVPIRAQRLAAHRDVKHTQKMQERVLTVKAQKKPCTKPVPFSLSQPKASTKPVPFSLSQPKASTKIIGGPRETLCSSKREPAEPSQPASLPPPRTLSSIPFTIPPASAGPATASLPLRLDAEASLSSSDPSALTGSARLFQDSVDSGSRRTPDRAIDHGSSSAQAGALRPVELTPSCRLIENAAPYTSSSLHSTGNASAFCPDPAALSSILQNEGLRAGGTLWATPRVSTCPLRQGASAGLPQRVSVMKSHHGAGPGAGGASQFSPDPAALRSILHNEGVRAGVTPGTTPRGSTCPAFRGSSFYQPQRVPVTKSRSGAVGVAPEAEHSRTPAITWTARRVPDTRPPSMMKLLSLHRTPIVWATPGLKSAQNHSQELRAQEGQENIVQRLFEEEEEHAGGLEGTQTQADRPSRVVSSNASKSGPGEEVLEKGSKNPATQPFIPAPHRESVIVFAQGKAVEGGAVVKQATPQDACTPRQVSAEVTEELLDRSSTVTAKPQQPASAPAPGSVVGRSARQATSALLRRLPPLEEKLLDEECSVYSVCCCNYPAPRPRCANPVASTLAFQDSIRFVPVSPERLPSFPSPCAEANVPGSCSAPVVEKWKRDSACLAV